MFQCFSWQVDLLLEEADNDRNYSSTKILDAYLTTNHVDCFDQRKMVDRLTPRFIDQNKKQTCSRQGQTQEIVIFGTWEFFYGLWMIQEYQLDHLLSLNVVKPFSDNVLIKHGGLPHVLPLVHYDFHD